MKAAAFLTLFLTGLAACGLLDSGDDGEGPRTIVFSAADEEGTSQIYTMREDGSGVRQLTFLEGGEFATQPAWSSDGTKLAFDRCLDCERGGGNHEIFVADLQTGAVDTLTRHPASDRAPTWSPDGEQLAFISDRDYAEADTMR